MIISSLFKHSKVVMFIDKILWKINKLDVFGNGYAGLKLRLLFYSLFCEYNLKTLKEKYKNMYETYASKELTSVYATVINDLIKSGREIVIVTKNVYAKNVLTRIKKMIVIDEEKIKLLTLNKNKKAKFKELVESSNGKACIIGNNLSDDILNSFKVGLPYLYIGRSAFVNFIINVTNKLFKKNGVQLDNIQKILSIFK